MSSIVSHFRFEGYKIDRIVYETIPEVGFLGMAGSLDPSGWKFEIAIRQPIFFKSIKKYIGGLDIKVIYPVPKEFLVEELPADVEKNLVKLDLGVAGIFSVEEGRLEKATEENLVKVQIPMLLFPYLRSAITSICAHGGLGSVVFPLMNIHELAKNANLQINEMD